MSWRNSVASKGYLGPLGDDFPAIFPIAMGLMFFFASITLTYDYYTSKQDIATLMKANVALAKAARSQIVFDDEHWDSVCRITDKTKANYGVRARIWLKEFDAENYEFSEDYEIGEDNPCVDIDGAPEGRFYISMTYPVLIPVEGGNKVATLEVMTWK